METPTHEIIVADTPENRQRCIDVRIQVFHHEQQFPLETEIDELSRNEDVATHFLLRLTPSLEPVGTVRLHKPAGKQYYKLTRLAVLKDYRRYRFGKELVDSLHAWLKANALQLGHDGPAVDVACHSQLPVQGFYARFGYTPQGELFEEDGAPHQLMVLRMPL
ncbi:acyl-CoA N-acyltransferase [Coprinopsis marcescibilis]|uniref:Acyl-CoA N-acyltransferase n=1 Tax=Coprinopsis marcescibilis TaxID=230819 RepID=A0A5C3KJ95_COPMA|nr:acyl-CoA N-acyltransferase [Coprinopsis marcescibilis]